LVAREDRWEVTYDAVIFDLYGTLVDFWRVEEYLKVDAELAAVLGVAADGLTRVLWGECIRDRNLGRLGGLEETLSHICGLLGGQPDGDTSRAGAKLRLDVTRRHRAPRAGVVETLITLWEIGLKVGLISDCFVEVPMTWSDTPFAPLIDAPVFSCTERVGKPDPEIYLAACDRLGVTPDRCLFVGDGGSSELTGARGVGMHPVLIRVDYDNHADPHRPDAPNWDGPVIASIPEVLPLVT
jgi:putative hydrolase of the HAD superfamily